MCEVGSLPRIRVLLLTEYYWPDEASTGRFLADLTARLRRDYPQLEFEVLTSTRVYRAGVQRRLPRKEEWDGIRITRLRSLRSGKDSFLRRAASDVLFSLQIAARVWRARCDILFMVTNPPLMAMLVGMVNRRRRIATVYLIHDLYPDVPVALGLWRADGAFVRALRWFQRTALEESTRVVVLGRCMQDYIVRNYRIDPGKITVIPSWFTVADCRVGGQCEIQADTFNVVYSGNLGQFQDFETILDGAELLRAYPSIRVHIVGDGARAAWLRDEVARRQLSNVVLRPFLPDDQFLELLRSASLGIVTLERNMEGLGVPSKTYNLLAMGVPLLAVLGEQSEVARLIAEHGLGYRVDHGDARGFASSVLHAYRNPEQRAMMAERARAYAYSEASPEAVTKRYAEELFRIAQFALH